ncbi:protease [Paenibacillus sp. Root52]|uniref:protease n=1 Tax=Paenibacillus sp. Root52 TaxID=1736552 RepID=UPI0006F64D12|nr:protease [Paenibacillus sp. Root52]KQY82577.1 protease [Paenibacillus sp. Root52]
MESIYWGCLIGGAIFAVVSLVLGDLIDGLLDGAFELPGVDFFKPVVLAGSITAFGGAGIMLTRYSSLSAMTGLILSLLIGIAAAILVFFAYIKPMRNSDVSIAFSMKDLSGKIGEITIPVPEKGFGEVMIRFASGSTIQTASSFEHRPIAAGARVVIIDVVDGVLRVSEWEDDVLKDV